MTTWWSALAKAIPSRARKELNFFIVLVARALWLERNARIFDRVANMQAELCRRITEEFKTWKDARLCVNGSERGIT
jgi:hypothetical protein